MKTLRLFTRKHGRHGAALDVKRAVKTHSLSMLIYTIEQDVALLPPVWRQQGQQIVRLYGIEIYSEKSKQAAI